MSKKYISFALISVILFYFYTNLNSIPQKDYDYQVKIYRDNWGVPHIYGNTDEDAAYGLAYAHAEDDFATIQDILLVSRGIVASVKGRDSAPIDYLVGLLGIWDNVEANIDKLSPKVIAICNAYADGINRYIEKHPKELLGNIYPLTGKDIIAGFAFRTPLMFRLDSYIQELMKDEKPNFSKFADTATEFSMYGSNMFAVAPRRSADGHTRIAINSHQPWEGPVTWYEAHIHSNEGWNITGALFPGSPVILKGHNKDIGWSHTVNSPDLVDIYELTINPENENQYLLDGQWIDFEIESLPINIKLLGPINWTFNRDLFYSKHGPVLKTSHGVYAIRYAGHGLIGQVEQWYKMNKATNLNEFKDAMRMMQIPMFNTLYADKSGNIFYIYNALIPKRKPGLKWHGIVPGDKSDLIWDSYYSFNELPQSTNPKSGYLQNCNSTPYLATIGRGNPKKTLPNNTGIEDFQTNRAYRANELYGQDKSITKEEFYEYKYDTYYSQNSVMKYALNRFLEEIDTNDSLLLEGIEILENWDLGNQKESRGAALAQLTFKLTYDINDFNYNYEVFFRKFQEATSFLMSEFGQLDIQLGELQLLKRGDVEYPLDGGPDILRAVYSKMDNNRKVATHGDCYFQMVDWDKNGELTAESIHQYGSATLDENSVHYNDQSELFSTMRMKPSYLKLEDITNELENSYKP